MVRSFVPTSITDATLINLLDLARQAPSAGNTSPTEYLVLRDHEATERYWKTTFATERRDRFAFPDLFAAPVLVIVLTRPAAYLARYGESDKMRSGLGAAEANWPVPFWWVDAGAVVQNLLLLAPTEGLGACFFGLFDHEKAVLAQFGVPEDRRAVGVVALGYPTPGPSREGRSAHRPRPAITDILHWTDWEPSSSS